MKRSTSELIAHGVVGGILAGLVVALWFFVVDSVAGRPLGTPAALARAMSDHSTSIPTFRLVVVYSLVHFGVFACLGICAAAVMAALHTAPRLLLGVIFGLVVQELIFYTGLFLSGVAPSEVIPWQHVVGANLLAGIVLMAYLHRALRSDEPLGFGALKAHPSLSRGLVTGLVGAVAVAAWFLLLDVISNQPFRTPGVLGSALLFGASNTDRLDINIGVIAAYTVVHFTAFAVAGIVFVMIAEQIERTPSLLLLGALTAIVLEAVVVATLALDAQWVLGALGVWSMLVANLLAVVSMGWYVWQTHPTLRHRLRNEPLNVRV